MLSKQDLETLERISLAAKINIKPDINISYTQAANDEFCQELADIIQYKVTVHGKEFVPRHKSAKDTYSEIVDICKGL